MGFFSLFRRKRRAAMPRNNKVIAPKASETLRNMQTNIDQLHSRISTIDIAIKKHDDQLAEHTTRLQEHGEKLQTLEQTVTTTPTQPLTPRQLMRQAAENATPMTQAGPAQQFDIERFTEQEKRVLAVFFQNKGMRMSYADVARTLNKSAYTIKNQMNQIRQKADLFDCMIGSQSRNLFTLKGDLRIEKYLKVGQPVERPLSMSESDQSDAEKAKPTAECAFLQPAA
jgi:DNA-binding CsgD family transcriptional regulator